MLKIGFLFNGPVGDAGWNYAHEIARLQLSQKFPEVHTIPVPSVPPEDAGRIMKNLIGQGVKALVATDASFAPAVKQLAHAYPDRVFFLCNSQYRAPNVITYCSKVYQPAYLCGMLAAKMSSTRHIAYLGELESPANLHVLNAFVLGAREVDRTIDIEVAETDARDQSEQGCHLVEEFIAKGVDVYFNGIHAVRPMQVAMDHGIFAIGFGTDLSSFASGQLLTSATFDWSLFYEKFIGELQQGSVAPGHRCLGIDSGAAKLGSLSSAVPPKVRAYIKNREQEIREGRLKIFTGPLYDTAGKLRIRGGTTANQDQIQNMSWMLQGLGNNLPATATKKTLKIFIVQSYEDDHVCGIPQEAGIRAALDEYFGKRVEIRAHYMKTKTLNSTPARMRADAIGVLRKIKEFAPHLVFTLDDNACREVGLKLIDKPFPVVFSGINEQPQYYNRIARFLDPQSRPIKNITGVYEKLHLQSALNVMQEVLPGLHHVVALLDESPTGQAIRKQLALEVPRELNGVKLTVRTVDTMAEYLAEIDKINADPDVQAVYPVVLSVKDSDSTTAGFRKTLATFQQRCRKPAIPVNFAFAQWGLFGGASVDFEAMGKQAGVMGAQLLRDKNIHHMPFESAQKAVITFNTSRAAMLGIDIPPKLLASAEIFTGMPLLESPTRSTPQGK